MLLLLTAKSLHICCRSLSFDGVSDGPCVREDSTGPALGILRTRGGDDQPQPSPELHLLTVCLVSTTYPNSRAIRGEAVRASDTLRHLHLAFSPRSPSAQEAAKKPRPTAKRPSRSCCSCAHLKGASVWSRPCSPQRVVAVGSPSPAQDPLPAPQPRAGQGQLPLPPALLFSAFDMN